MNVVYIVTQQEILDSAFKALGNEHFVYPPGNFIVGKTTQGMNSDNINRKAILEDGDTLIFARYSGKGETEYSTSNPFAPKSCCEFVYRLIPSSQIYDSDEDEE